VHQHTSLNQRKAHHIYQPHTRLRFAFSCPCSAVW
jgi:hypothetical protein